MSLLGKWNFSCHTWMSVWGVGAGGGGGGEGNGGRGCVKAGALMNSK